MNNILPNQVVIENVLVSKIRGKIAYQGNISATTIMGLYYVK